MPISRSASRRGTLRRVSDILVASDADWLVDEIEAAVAGTHLLHRVKHGGDVVDAVAKIDPDLVLLDFQIGNMGGVAACLEVRQQQEAGRLNPNVVYLLLDREADVFLANQAGADGWLIKPLNAFSTLRAIDKALAACSESR